jgi:hypothetical protein
MQRKIIGNVLIVAGPRNYFNREVISDALVDTIIDYEIVKILTGDATGVDQIVAELCYQSGMEYEQFPAAWDKYGKSAGPRRNWDMALHGTHLLAFYNGSLGTSNMIYFAERHDLKVIKINI